MQVEIIAVLTIYIPDCYPSSWTFINPDLIPFWTRKKFNLLSWLILPICFSPEGRVSVHTQVWSWFVSQKQQVCISTLRTGKCSWVLQFTHIHDVPNRIYSHEGTLSAGVNLYHSTVFKGIAYFFTQKKDQSNYHQFICICGGLFFWKSQLFLESDCVSYSD